jgi:hypothetical protein
MHVINKQENSLLKNNYNASSVGSQGGGMNKEDSTYT